MFGCCREQDFQLQYFEFQNIPKLLKKGKEKMPVKLPPCFKSYDIRGKVPEELNSDLARRIGRCFSTLFQTKKVVVARDIRPSGDELVLSLSKGLMEMGTEVLDLGLCGTEEIYHAAFSLESDGVDGGIIVTASHNPADYNGMKFVVKGARPVTGESGLVEIGQMIVENRVPVPTYGSGVVQQFDNKVNYRDHLLSYIDINNLRPLKIVVNSGNGCAGPILDMLEERLPFEFVKLHHDPDGSFPNGVPNPLLLENREVTGRTVVENSADLGLGWDGDFDRCFFWDENGRFIEGYYIVGLLAKQMLIKDPGAKILYDPRLVWNTVEEVEAAGGEPVITRTGHAFIKERMRQEDSVYGGEMSAHHYFRDFGYCDSGMIPWLLVCSYLSEKNMKLSELVSERMKAFPVSGEINRQVSDPDSVIEEIAKAYASGQLERIDGLSVSFDDWRFNIRKSNTEPLIRLNVETRNNKELLQEKVSELLGYIV